MGEWEKKMLKEISHLHNESGYCFHRNLLNLMRHEIKLAVKEISTKITKDGWIYIQCLKILAKRGVE